MFSPALGRALRSSTSSISAPPACRFSRAAAVQPFARPSHQRRLSSSKASIPPGAPKENRSSSTQQTATSESQDPPKKATRRTGRKRTPAPPVLNVPHVPPTDYLLRPEVNVSSFFSLHRPISLSTPVPPVTTEATFDSIFAARAPGDKKTIMDNLQTLSNGVESLEAALRQHEKQLPADSRHQDPEGSDFSVSGSPEDIMSRFVPFVAPPAPAAHGLVNKVRTAAGPVNEVSIPTSVKQRSWSTEVVVTESTDATGKRTYSATTAPMVEISVSPMEKSQKTEFEARQPFLGRMKQRQLAHTGRRANVDRPDALAISVKRQRKLKMKKHKYKKLMKRTRLERRKLDRT